MKIIVVSDTHGLSGNFINVVEDNKDMDLLIFLGDGERDIEEIQHLYPNIKCSIVRGNSDRESSANHENLIKLGKYKTFITHGDRYCVKQSLEDLEERAEDLQVDIALYGHTHAADYQEINGIHYFCPGSLSMPQQGERSYGVITVDVMGITFKIVTYK